MLKHTTKFTSLLLAAGTLFSGTCVSAEQANPADPSEGITQTYSTSLYTSGLYSTDALPENVFVTHDIRLDYDKNTVYDSYLIRNESSSDASFDVLIPQVTSLAAMPQKLYSFTALSYDTADKDALSSLDLFSGSDSASFEESDYYSPLFSANGLSETSLTLDELYQGQFYNTDIPEDMGVLYHLSRPVVDSSLNEKAYLSISGLSDNCHIYPLGCSYTTTDDGYELSITEGFFDCYVFLTGTEDKDFTVSPIETQGSRTELENFSIEQEDSDLKSYLEFCCDWYLEENPDKTQATPELLLSNLADYFGRSSVTVSIDLLPTIDWLTQQKRFLVHQYSIEVPAGLSVFVWTEREIALSKKEVTLSAQLAQDTTSYANVSDTVTIPLPQGYSSLVVRSAENSKLSNIKDDNGHLLVYSLKSYKGDTYSVALFKTPMWNATLKYLPVFIVIMAVFMLLCLISYLSRRKKG